MKSYAATKAKATAAGLHTFRALVEAGRDTFAQNDRAESSTIVKGDPRILVVSIEPQQDAQLVEALRSARLEVRAVGDRAASAQARRGSRHPRAGVHGGMKTTTSTKGTKEHEEETREPQMNTDVHE